MSKKGTRTRPRAKLLTATLVGALVMLAAAFEFGYLVAPRDGDSSSGPAPAGESASTFWTCSMHPQIELPEPGKCPICFMDLIPLADDSGGGLGPRQLKLSATAAHLAEIQTTPAKRQHVANVVRMVGKVDYDETRVANITAWVPGRLDRLYVDYTGVTVRKGDHLVDMYSRDLILAQRELLEAMKSAERLGTLDRELSMSTLKSVEDRLRRWGLLPEQIDEIKRRGQPTDHLTIYAPIGGIVIEKLANQGMYVQTGTKIYTIADLSVVWVFLEAYESDVPWLRYGQDVEFTTEAYPGEIFNGRVTFIDPILDDKTRTVQVRLNVPNAEGKLKPGMFVRATVRSRVAAGGKVLDPSLVGKWISPMHPEIIKDGPGKCDVCGMDLVPAEELGYIIPEQSPEVPLVIPATAPLITGKRAVVYVQLPDREEPTFEGREVLLGQRAGDFYIVRHGLKEGDLVVTKGNFKIDSALQLKWATGKLSMMSPEDALASADEQAGAQLEVPQAFTASLTPVYQSYLAAASALAGDDLDAARKSVRAILEAVDQTDARSSGALAALHLSDAFDVLSRWKRLSDQIIFAANETVDAKDQAGAREHFAELSSAVVWLARSFSHDLPEPIYQVHCRMAFGGQQADWLQTGRDTRNPYFGAAMLRCGSRTATFYPQTPLDNVPAEFRGQLAGLYGAYLRIQEALADDRLPDAVTAWQAMLARLDSIRPDALTGPARRTWEGIRQDLQEGLTADWKDPQMDPVRSRFEGVSMTMLSLVALFGHTEDGPLSRAFCPMAFDNKGAAWLQAGDTVANPYFGHQMLRCGTIQRTFAAAGSPPAEKKPVRENPVRENPVREAPR